MKHDHPNVMIDRCRTSSGPGTTTRIALVLLAVAPAVSASAQEPEVRDSAGVTIVVNRAKGQWSAGEAWQVEADLRIGVAEGHEWYSFGQICGVAVSSAGRIYVRDLQSNEIWAYSPEGVYEKRVARYGYGPGELAGHGPIFVDAGDTLHAPDPRGGRISRYAPNDSVLSQRTVTIEPGAGVPIEYTVGGSGAVFAKVVKLRGMPPKKGMPPTGQGTIQAIVLMGEDGSLSDTVLTFPAGIDKTYPGSATITPIKYGEGPLWTVTANGKIVYGWNSQYRISVYSGEGSLESVITRPHRQEPFGRDDLGAIERSLAEFWGRVGTPASTITRLFEVLNTPDYYPAFVDLKTGPGGTIWANHYLRYAEMSEARRDSYLYTRDFRSPRWDVFNSAGVFLGTVEMPDRFEAYVFTDERVYGVWRDELDVEYVMVLRFVFP